jgi:hypothetical protein
MASPIGAGRIEPTVTDRSDGRKNLACFIFGNEEPPCGRNLMLPQNKREIRHAGGMTFYQKEHALRVLTARPAGTKPPTDRAG